MKYFYFTCLLIISLFLSINAQEHGDTTHDLFILTDSIHVLSPNGGEKWQINTPKEIKWESSQIENVKIEFTTDDSTWITIVSSISADIGSYYWLTPNIPYKFCKIRISDVQDTTISDSSDGFFSIGKFSEMEPNNTLAEANLIEIGDSLSASIDPIGDIDYFKFYANAGDTVLVELSGQNNSTLYGYVAILNEEDSLLNYNYYYYEELKLPFIVPFTGDYYIGFPYNFQYSQSKINSRNSLENVNKIHKKILNGCSKISKTSQTGVYTILLKKYKPSAPTVTGLYLSNTDFNSTSVEVDYCANGLNTKISLEYGTALNSRKTMIIADTLSGISNNYILAKLIDLNPNTTYYVAAKAENSLGTAYSDDYNFLTPEKPSFWTIKSLDSLFIWCDLYDVSFINENTGFIIGQCYSADSAKILNIILETIDGGNSWSLKYSNDQLTKIFCIDSLNVVAFDLTDSSVIKSTNGGTTWSTSNIQNSQSFSDLFFTDVNNGIIIGSNGLILKTTDGGSNWKTVNINCNYSLNSICFTDRNNGWIAGESGTILKTTDGGSTWKLQNCGTTNYLYSICFVNSSDGFFLDNWYGYIYKTTDGGTSWNYQSCPVYLNEISFLDKNVGVGLSNNYQGSIWLTTDAGKSWNVQKSGTTNYLYSICKAGNNWFTVGSYGTILKSSYTLVSVKDETKTPLFFDLNQNYPNPFNPSTNFEFQIGERGLVSLKVYDVLGKEVATIVNKELPAGNYKYQWNAGNLASGVYFYRLKSGNFVETKKLILLR